jgi:hypothetical protein
VKNFRESALTVLLLFPAVVLKRVTEAVLMLLLFPALVLGFVAVFYLFVLVHVYEWWTDDRVDLFPMG